MLALDAPIGDLNWASKLQSLVHYYVPDVPRTPAVYVAGIAAVVVGLLLVLRSAKFSRWLVTAFGLCVGVWLGHQASLLVGTPGPITAALGAVLVAILAYRTYRWWLAAGSVIALFTLATTYQLGRGDLQRLLPAGGGAKLIDSVDGVSLPTAEQQKENLHGAGVKLERMKQAVAEELKAFGVRGWILPIVAAILGGLLAWWALGAFAVLWMGLLGAALTVSGVVTLLCAQWPDMRTPLASHPQILTAGVVSLWLVGLLLQAKEARFPRPAAPPPAPAAKDPPKS